MTDFHKTCVEDATWEAAGPVEVYIYADGGGCPGEAVAIFETDNVMREPTGGQLFDRDIYIYWIEFDAVDLDAGTYHIGSRWPAAGGTGSNTSDAISISFIP